MVREFVASLWMMLTPAAPVPAPTSGTPVEQAPLPAVQQCEQIVTAKADVWDSDKWAKVKQQWLDVCREALAIDGENMRVRAGLARALSAHGQKDEALVHWRAAAAKDDPDALFNIFETHKSFSRGDVNRTPLVGREEGARALLRAAELGHSDAMSALAARLDRGTVVKRDPATARYWAERILKNSKGHEADSAAVFLGRMLAESEDDAEHARGIRILEHMAKYRGDAQAQLAKAIRKDDPVRARELLEKAWKTYPGHAAVALADMLIMGEGGAKDEKRAVGILTRVRDVGSVQAALGRLHLEGRLVPSDIEKAVEKIRHGAVWSYETKLELLALLSANPSIKTTYYEGILYDVVEAAELGEPGALAALIQVKLSGHVQFGDKAGGCALAKRAAETGQADIAAKYAAMCTG